MTIKTRYVKSDASVWQPNAIARIFVRVLVMLPVTILARLGRGLGLMFYLFDKKRGHYADINLRTCFPELNEKAIRDMRRAHFKALGQSLMCTLGLTWHRPRQRLQQWLKIEGYEYIKAAKQKGNNIIIMAPHFVGLELE